MNMEKIEKNAMYESILMVMPNKREKAITSKRLSNYTGLTTRQLMRIISDLREYYPICSKMDSGGGYWLADNDFDIIEFNGLIRQRRNEHNKTIQAMDKHLGLDNGGR